MGNKRKWYPDRDEEPMLGSVNGEHDVYFKVSDDGHTLIADAEHGTDRFESRGTPGTTNYQVGHHDHYGSGNGRNNNGTERGWYTGPDA